MRIVHLVAGAGGMYCGSCLHGNTLVAAQRRAGVDALLLPMYTPLRTDEPSQSVNRIVFGGVSVYLQQRFPLLRRTPWLLDRLWDRPALLGWLARRSSTTNAGELGDLCVSMLQGPEGRQRKELEKLVRLLDQQFQPDVIHLNNALLLGTAGELRRRLGTRVVCSLTGEDSFVEKLPGPWRERAWDLLRQQAVHCDAMIAMNAYYADQMADRLQVPRERIEVIPPGISTDGYPPQPPEEGRAKDTNLSPRPMGEGPGVRAPNLSPRPMGEGPGVRARPIRIGTLARVCPDKGLHLAAEALIHLHVAEQPGTITGSTVQHWQNANSTEHGADCGGVEQRRASPAAKWPTSNILRPASSVSFELHAAGFLDPAERGYLESIQRRLADAGLAERFVYHGELDRPGKIALLQSLDVFCLPTVFPESKGLSVLEAWAAGVPAVLPRLGAFPEMIADSGAGVLHEPNDAQSLAEAIVGLISDAELEARCRCGASEAIARIHSDDLMARRTVEVYERITRGT